MKTISLMALGLLAASCATATTPNYSVTTQFTPDEDGLTLYMLDYDSGTKLDSTLVEDGVATLKGVVETPVMVQLVLDGSRVGQFILEPATITVDPSKRKIDTDGTLAASLNSLSRQLMDLRGKYQSASDSERRDIVNRYDALVDSAFNANADNPVGLTLFMEKAYEMNLQELDSALNAHPVLASSQRVQKLRKALVNKAETSVGQMFKDFEIKAADGSVQRLSDYVGKGQYTLVDFWASWCGPCIRETKVIKELYNKYNEKGLEVLGVAVWDEPANTLKAIEQHQLPWKQIINAQSIPTDIYGISGIPCIILFDPEGRIVSRDKQDDALVNDVDNAMSSFSEK